MVEVDNLVKHYGPIKAVNGVSFQVKKGEVLGFLGPNGAGKSTTMKMITCFLTPSSGTARVQGFDITKDPVAVRQQVGYLPESAPLYDEMSVESFLGFIANVRGYYGAEARRRIDKVYETCQIQSVARQAIHTLSKGYRQRVCFAQALLHDPGILILDEPTDGLDPNQKQAVRELIASMKDDKVIILSTHILEEVDAICSRAIIISQGVVKVDGTPEQLRQKSRLHGAVTFSASNIDENVKKGLQSISGVQAVEAIADKQMVRCIPQVGEVIAPKVLEYLRDKKCTPSEFRVEQGRLDEVFRNITKTVK